VNLGSRTRLLVAAALAAGLVAAPLGSAAPNASLTVQLAPGAVSAGQPALAVATFRNIGHATLPNVVVDLQFPNGLTVPATPAGCTRANGSLLDIACSLGDVVGGGTRHVYVRADVAKNLGTTRSIHVTFALRVGPGVPSPILTGASAQVLASTDAANRGNCKAVPTTLVAEYSNQVTALISPPKANPSLKLPCTPLAVGVDPAPAGRGFKTKEAAVGVPNLVHPAVVKLTFPNETLPDEKWEDDIPAGRQPSFDNPHPLWRFDPETGKLYVVPRCLAGGKFPAGWHSCVLQVHATDVCCGPSDDLDQGWIKLLVQGSGFGDPRYMG
jgi:hypothetical protein